MSLNATASDPSLALRLQRDRLREYLPHLWEGFHLGRLELVEVELKRFFTAIQNLHNFQYDRERLSYERHTQDRLRWEGLEQSLTDGIPGLVHRLSVLIPELESGFMSESDPELRSRLAFCLGGLKRIQSQPALPSTQPIMGSFPGKKSDSESEKIARIVKELKQKTSAPLTPAELLGRLEIVCAGRWFAHCEQIKSLHEISVEAERLGEEARKTAVSTVVQRFFPILDTMESILPTDPDPGERRPWFGALRTAGTWLLEYLAEREIVPLEVQVGVAFNPEWHACGWVGRSVKPAPRIVIQALRRGYRVKTDVIRPAEVETVLA